MRKIIYPFSSNSCKKIEFNNIYYKTISDKNKLKVTEINKILKKIDTNYNLEILLTSDFLKLIEIQDKIVKSKYKKTLESFFVSTKNKKQVYVYESFQPIISNFFMEQKIDLQSCHYCNIDFINTFEEHYQFASKEDFILKAPVEILVRIEEISEETARKIIKNRNLNNLINNLNNILGKRVFSKFEKWYNRKIEITSPQLDLNNIVVKKNHYTLDHILPKNEFSFISLSVYNLVPSCYSCNSKFKHIKEFTVNKELDKICPTSDNFILDELLKFKLSFNVNEPDFDDKIAKIKEIKDVDVQFQNLNSSQQVNEFIEIFKLKSRYEFHKNISFDLIEKRKLYPDSALDEIEKIFHNNGIYIDKNTFKKQIFGQEIFQNDNTNIPFEKYKKDIAIQLGLISQVKK